MGENGQRAPDGAAAIVTALARAGTTVLFGVPGGGPNLDVVGAAQAAGLRFVLTHTETAAVIMAATWADLTGRPGAAVVTRGPGLASAVNGIAHAALDRLPVVVIADTVRSAEAARISHQRLDLAALGRSAGKSAITVGRDRPGEAAAEAVRLALQPPAGPVVALMDDTGPSGPFAHPEPADQDRTGGDHLAVLAGALRAARRPVLLLGTGAIAHTAAIRSALSGRGLPVLHTYRARGVLPDSGGEAAGLVTGATMEWPLLAAADLILGLGVDEAEMIPGTWDYPAPTLLAGGHPPGPPAYFTGATWLPLTLPAAIGVLAAGGPGHDWPPDAGRAARAAVTGRLAATASAPAGALSPVQVVTAVRSRAPREAVVTVDAGAHMLAVMPLWETDAPGRLLISSGLATMGYALPAAIGAALAGPGPLVIAFTGDGGLGMTLAELETAVRLRLRIAVVVFNDSTLSLIKIKQRQAGQGGPEAVGYGAVSYADVARAMGAVAVAAGTEDEVAQAISAAAHRDGPTVIDVRTDPASYPAIMELSRGQAGRVPRPGPQTSPGTPPGRMATAKEQC